MVSLALLDDFILMLIYDSCSFFLLWGEMGDSTHLNKKT